MFFAFHLAKNSLQQQSRSSKSQKSDRQKFFSILMGAFLVEFSFKFLQMHLRLLTEGPMLFSGFIRHWCVRPHPLKKIPIPNLMPLWRAHWVVPSLPIGACLPSMSTSLRLSRRRLPHALRRFFLSFKVTRDILLVFFRECHDSSSHAANG